MKCTNLKIKEILATRHQEKKKLTVVSSGRYFLQFPYKFIDSPMFASPGGLGRNGEHRTDHNDIKHTQLKYPCSSSLLTRCDHQAGHLPLSFRLHLILWRPSFSNCHRSQVVSAMDYLNRTMILYFTHYHYWKGYHIQR